MKRVVLIVLAFVLTVSSFAIKKGKRIPMRRSTMSIFGSVKAKRTLERTRLELYQDDGKFSIEVQKSEGVSGLIIYT